MLFSSITACLYGDRRANHQIFSNGENEAGESPELGEILIIKKNILEVCLEIDDRTQVIYKGSASYIPLPALTFTNSKGKYHPWFASKNIFPLLSVRDQCRQTQFIHLAYPCTWECVFALMTEQKREGCLKPSEKKVLMTPSHYEDSEYCRGNELGLWSPSVLLLCFLNVSLSFAIFFHLHSPSKFS